MIEYVECGMAMDGLFDLICTTYHIMVAAGS